MDEMSMGGLEGNTVRDANGVGIYCNDHSMCMVTGNRVTGTRRDDANGDRTRAGFGLEVVYGAEAEVSGNDLAGNPARVGVFLDSQLTRLADE
jgi:parallel beta-helix repeat protein